MGIQLTSFSPFNLCQSAWNAASDTASDVVGSTIDLLLPEAEMVGEVVSEKESRTASNLMQKATTCVQSSFLGRWLKKEDKKKPHVHPEHRQGPLSFIPKPVIPLLAAVGLGIGAGLLAENTWPMANMRMSEAELMTSFPIRSILALDIALLGTGIIFEGKNIIERFRKSITQLKHRNLIGAIKFASPRLISTLLPSSLFLIALEEFTNVCPDQLIVNAPLAASSLIAGGVVISSGMTYLAKADYVKWMNFFYR